MMNENDYVITKYIEFYKKNGYLPEFFNAYNSAVITDLAPSITCACGSIGGSCGVAIIEIIMTGDSNGY